MAFSFIFSLSWPTPIFPLPYILPPSCLNLSISLCISFYFSITDVPDLRETLGLGRPRNWAMDWPTSTEQTNSRVKSGSSRNKEGRDVKNSTLCRAQNKPMTKNPYEEFNDAKPHSLTTYICLFIHLVSSSKYFLSLGSVLTTIERLPWVVYKMAGQADK